MRRHEFLGFFPIERNMVIFLFEEGRRSDGAVDMFATNALINRIRNFGFPSVMSGVAASFMKTGLENSNATVNGTIETTKVFGSVQWYRLILSAFLVVLGITIFTGTAASNKKANIPLWKSSALAPFYHGLEELEGNEFKSASVIEATAEKEDVRLRYSEANG